MRVLVLILAVVAASGCAVQTAPDTPSDDAPTSTSDATPSIDLEALGLIDRARTLAPFVGGPLRDAQAAVGRPSPVAQTTDVGGADGGAQGWSTSRSFLYGDVPSVIVLEAEGERLVSASVVQEDVDAFAVVYGLEDDMTAWLGPIEYDNVDHGYYVWETDDWTFTAQAASESRLELIVAER